MVQLNKEHFFSVFADPVALFAQFRSPMLNSLPPLVPPDITGRGLHIEGYFLYPPKDIVSISGFCLKSRLEKKVSLGAHNFHYHFP